MNIAILAGGNSSEHRISVKSGREIKNWLDKAGYTSYFVTIKGEIWSVKDEGEEYPVDLNIFGFKKGKKEIKFGYAWIIIHGTPGENGMMQGYLDLMSIPYNTAGLLSSALTFNKQVAKTYLKQFGVLTAESRLIVRGEHYSPDEVVEAVGLPCFVKPNNGGSSYGTTRVAQVENLKSAIDLAFKEDNEVIVESYVKGTEVTCGLLKTAKEEYIFPLTEIVTNNDFFDYKAKYEGLADEITPARIDPEIAKKCQSISSSIYDFTQCRGLVRIDFIIRGNQIYFLEVNSVPGMTKESILPQQINAMNMEVESVLKYVIEDTNR
jgi:D-alanine-D-alanine ligase